MSLFSLDSSSLPSQGKKVDCHALPSDNARNDSKNATNKKVDSSKAYSASAESIDCHAIATALARNDNAFSPSLRGRPQTFQPHLSLQADEAFLSSLRGSGDSHNEAIHKNIKTQNADSRIFTQTAQSVETPKNAGAESAFDTKAAGGRIFDEKAGLCSLLCGDKPSGLSHKQKANSPLFRKKPTPKAESFNKTKGAPL
ncbi:hypothetical protein [Helicobacter canis]|uniref:Uncharacterized protein n=1 Tax=Helicobacter canis NCTC 12740 TaxID=1357399 RepID=V8CE31_9HELI|nr:hypothetical protein [Helicobacter canis]ETD25678.1 hypothetical protein HMPREF2087_01506 [Helicobacter canis NCTC 12740]